MMFIIAQLQNRARHHIVATAAMQLS